MWSSASLDKIGVREMGRRCLLISLMGLCFGTGTTSASFQEGGRQDSWNEELRVPFCKNQTNFKFRGKGRKFDFAHILMVDSLGYDKNYWIVFLAKYPFISKKYANYQSLLKSLFDAPFYLTSLRASHAKPHHSSHFKTLKYLCTMFKGVLG